MEDWIVRLRERLSSKFKDDPHFCAPIKPSIEQHDLPLAASSTSSIAGSWERIEVYRQRVEAGVSLFHPQDCKDICIRHSHNARVG